MKPRPSRRGLWTGLVLGGLFPTTALAQLMVFDPSNHAANVLQAARALEQINNQIQSLQNQALSLANQARNLAQLPYSALASIQAHLDGIGELMSQAQRIAYDLGAIDEAFAKDYQVQASASDLALLQAAQARWANSASAFKDALGVQARVVAGLSSTSGELRALTQASQGAQGVVQAAQAGNQLLALQSQQLTELVALLAAQGRAEALAQADREASRLQAREQFQRFIGRSQGYAPQPVEIFR